METPSPRAASVLCGRALGHLDLVQPETLREPIRFLLLAAIETCATRRSLIGDPMVPTLEIARGLLAAVPAPAVRDEAAPEPVAGS